MRRTRKIETGVPELFCGICGRTLLRGERAHRLGRGGSGSMGETVCELCAPRALADGWWRVEDDEHLSQQISRRSERRASISRLLRRRGAAAVGNNRDDSDASDSDEPDVPAVAAPSLGQRIHAVPANDEYKIEHAVERFNDSPFPRRLAGIARSLGLPTVAVSPELDQPGIVTVVVAWEICWYRYEVDLAMEEEAVRSVGQGSELAELGSDSFVPNAELLVDGRLSVANLAVR